MLSDMIQVKRSIEGTVSPKFQITIPAQIREALGLHPGEKLEFTLNQSHVVEMRVKRPKPSDIIAEVLKQHDLSHLATETGNDAVAAQKKNRWGRDK
jgi:antitoxin PrlF